MTDQLLLLEDAPTWRLDRSTREQGRRGVAAAREVLRASQARARAAQLADRGATDELPTELAPAA